MAKKSISLSFTERFLHFWELHFAPQVDKDSTIIVAISGGMDSVVLAYLIKEIVHLNIELAHCNFHLRGEESDRDELFVRNFAEQLGVHLHIQNFDTIQYANSKKLSIEEAARNLRYDWFRQLARREGRKICPIFVAHHANDSIETLLNNFFRGTGIAGLQGIQAVNNGIFRPLLFAKRKEIVHFALQNNLQWVEDSTNASSDYTRNYLRNEVLPELKSFYPTIEDNLLGNIHRFKDLNYIYLDFIRQTLDKILLQNGAGFKISIADLLVLEPLDTILFELAKKFDFGTRQVSEWKKILDGESGSAIVSPTWKLWKDRTELYLIPIVEDDHNVFIINEPKNYELPNLKLSFSTLKHLPEEKTTDILYLDLSKVTFPFTIRHWKDGDFFYPNGMKGKKKLAKYFIDEKIPVVEKGQIWLLTKEDVVVWVIGLRADRRFLADENSTEILAVRKLLK
ncbi:tRNA lysidine(34) synthetase TilS [Rhizosphaericola mali]|uniref:tRNA(Ile)-lysidine synthase n=1 Tax=Rhizosphaericola mali TaxID=2545455 RepID=A0A5P2G8I5_9BACT|nr:tRNA lysidine(34) synthetase TilS [Rhizosphaericola mali]QES87831.1 tRNA lysidine(34) synthetase TilS [Rhizosphaericola mali]